MTRWSLERKWITGGFSLALLLMGTVSYVSYQNATRLITSANQVRHTNTVLKTLTDVVATLTDAESGRRGYILFGDEDELERYKNAIQNIDPTILQLRQLLSDDSSQQQRLSRLEALIAQRVALYRQSTELYRENKSPSAQAFLITQIKQNKREIRQVVTEMQAKEEQLLEEQVNQSQSGFQYRMLIEFLGPLLSFVVLLSVYTLLYRQMVKRQKAEALQRILEQEKELGELKLDFFSMVSHEFRTPLSIILGSAQLLEQGSQNSADSKKIRNLHRIQSSARLMTKLLTDILTLTRAEAGKLECKPELIDLESFCLNLVEDIQVSSEHSHLIKLVNQGHYTHANLDEKLLYSILNNLLSNAIKYSPKDKDICFIFNCEPDIVTFEIKDLGIGIPQEELRSLYAPFYRSKNVGNIVGSGLGLAVVKKCLDLHRGSITVESAVGIGTTFTVKIPQEIAAHLH
jgi:signal transduction histidine kinase